MLVMTTSKVIKKILMARELKMIKFLRRCLKNLEE